MPQYSFIYEEVQVYEVVFEADTKSDAEAVMEAVQDGEIDPISWDEPSASYNDKAYELIVDTNSLTRTDGEDV